ncbi:MAG: hypothetical protein H7Y00_08220 [Fimbriimonadaceae bacterium]|nr:hypothetical protein [Chitinophagales bacterium]
MLGYSDFHGNFYVYDTDRSVHLEHQKIQSVQFKQNSIAYMNSSGELKYYSNHQVTDLEISNPRFYLNTDHYLYYSFGYNFSLYDGKKKETLGFIQNNPYAFSDSIAAMHDYANYFFVYWKDKFVELEQHPVKYIRAGKNIVAYVDDQSFFKIFYQNEKLTIDNNPPYTVQCASSTVSYIDNYRYFKIFWSGKVYEMYNASEIYCSNDETVFRMDYNTFCDAQIVVAEDNLTPLFKTGDDIVAFIDDEERFNIFYKGISNEYYSSVPKQYDVIDNMIWWVDDNNFFHVFYDGEDYLIESYTPKKIRADKNTIVYTDNYGKLKAFFMGESLEVTSSIILDFELNNELIMYNVIPNKYEFYKLK